MVKIRALSLLERDVSDRVVLAIGHQRPGAETSNPARLRGPGITTFNCVGIEQSGCIQEQLLKQTCNPDLPVHAAVDVSRPTERHIATTMGRLRHDIVCHQVTRCADLGHLAQGRCTHRLCTGTVRSGVIMWFEELDLSAGRRASAQNCRNTSARIPPCGSHLPCN